MDRSETAGLRINLLGPIEINGACGALAGGRSAHELHEIAVAIYLNPGISTTALGQTIDRLPRDVMALVSRTRRWLGPNPKTRGPYLSSGGRYTLHAATSDWTTFSQLANGNPKELAAAGDQEHLVAALELVRDRPLADIPVGRWLWADAWLDDAIDLVVATAHATTKHALTVGDLELASWATRKGRRADPYTEILARDELRTAYAAGVRRRIRNTIARMIETARTFGVGLDPATRELLARLGSAAGEIHTGPASMSTRPRRIA